MKKLAWLLALVMLIGCFAMTACSEEKDAKEDKDNKDKVVEVVEDDADTTTTAPVETPDGDTPSDDPTDEPEEPEAEAMSLFELPVVADDGDLYEDSDTEDAYGNTYEGTIYEMSMVCYDKGAECGAEVNVDGQYRYLTGTFFAADWMDEDQIVEFFVLADDDVVYYSGQIDRRTRAIDFVVDIKNCDIVTVKGRTYDEGDVVLVNATVTNEIAGDVTPGEEFDQTLIPLDTLHIYDDKNAEYAGMGKDAFGNVYYSMAYELNGHKATMSDDIFMDYIEFVVDGKYSTFYGTVFAGRTMDDDESIEMRVYADDKLVYTESGITKATKAIDFEIDIENCDILKIEAYSTGRSMPYPAINVVNAFVQE